MATDADEVWERYALDGSEALAAIEESLLRLEHARTNREELNRLYRGLHTVKGNSAFMGLACIERLAHACEDLIGLSRDQGVPFDDEAIELVLAAVDRLRTLVTAAGASRRDGGEAQIAEPLAAIEGKLQQLGAPAVSAPVAEAPPAPVAEAPITFIDPAADPGYLEVFLALAQQALKDLSPALATLLLERDGAVVARVAELCDELSLACERMGFEPLVHLLQQLTTAAQAPTLGTNLTDLELALHTALVNVETQYRSICATPQSFGITELYRRACANAAFADLAQLRELIDAPTLELSPLRETFHRLTAACAHYGFQKGVDQSLDLEDKVARALEGGGQPERVVMANVVGFIERLGKAIFAVNSGEELPDIEGEEAADDNMKFAPEVANLPFSTPLTAGLTRTGLAALTHFRAAGRSIIEVHAALEQAADLQGPFTTWLEAAGGRLVSSSVVELKAGPLYVFLLGFESVAEAALASLRAVDAGRGGLVGFAIAPGSPRPDPAAFQLSPPKAVVVAPTARVTDEPAAEPVEERGENAASKTEFLRIDARKVSMIMDMAGEIGLACGAVTHHPDLVGQELEGYHSAAHKLEMLIRELQSEVSGMRLVQVAGVFGRMQRVVRDTARRTGKKVELVLLGEDTEIDKLMVDALHDPLVHMIRNAIDHGLETPAERVAAGKRETGRIVLEASHQGGEVLVQVSDDGRGMNRERIVARAQERGLLPQGRELSEQEILELVFLPGFSTKESIDELSGRGVGMDVIKTTIEGLRGRVELRTTPGKGSQVMMRVPLTLAFVEAMIVREGARLFAVPIEKVYEVFQAKAAQIVHNSAEAETLVRVREKLVPVLWLPRFYGEPSTGDEALDGRLLVVVQTSRGELALPVDALLGNQQVMLKPLTGALTKVRAAAGCGMLRSGEVALALDCERLSA
jgi:two-component system, chemotaxis family, sensor kinase CheA